jgi:acetyltransferase
MSTKAQASPEAGLLIDPAHDLLRPDTLPLDAVFKPKAVALIGATDRVGSVGRMVLSNLIGSPFGGSVYPVNAKRDNILGIHAYKSLHDIPERPDCIVITTPSDGVPELIRDAVGLGVPAAIVISAGFKEIG